jgi:hypothetical protein
MKTSELRMRDPYIIEPTPGQFVLFGTTDENLWGGPGTGFDCYTSSDLENWEGPIEAFRPPVGFWGDTQFWAPEVHEYRGRFYMFATFASSTGSPKFRGVASLVSDSVTGPFLPWSEGALTPADIPCLDGTLFVDEDSVPWLVFSHGAEGIPGGAPGNADSSMYAMRLSEDLKAPAGEVHTLFKASSAPWSKPLWFPPGVEPPEQLNLAKDPMFTDGPYFVSAPGGALLMMWSSFGEEGYAIGVAVSESGSVLGPWVQNPEPLWARNGGHGMILRTSDARDLLVFHWPNDTPNERVKITPVVIEADGIRLA